MSISTPFIQRPIATSLLMAGIFLVGLVTFPMLPVAPLPQVDFPTIQVSANLPGASPETMASSVAMPLEYQISQIPGVSELTSSSTLGQAQITVQFDLDRNIDSAAQDIQTAIAAAGGQLPKNLPSPPSQKKQNPADAPILMLVVSSDILPTTKVDDYAETILAQQISRIPGVGLVNIGGQQKPAVRVQVDPAKLAAMGIQLEDVASVISQATVDSPKGSINGDQHLYTLYANDQLLAAAPWNDVVIAYKNGAPVRVRDIGVAVDGPENSFMTAWVNGHSGIVLMINKQPGANVIDTVKRIQALLPHAMLSLPPSVKLSTLLDRTLTIRAAVKDVELTLILSIILVVGVIFLFLRNAWATIIPGITVPLSLLGTAAMMYVAGYSLDNLSLMGLTIAVGFVVDDAIVMLENIYRHIEAGMNRVQAAIKGAQEVGFTIVSISLSLVAVFIPLLLMSGIMGRLFREFAVTVTMTIAVSAFVALTLSPMMCSLFLQNERAVKHGRLYMLVERGFEAMVAGYTRGLDFVLRHQRTTLLTWICTVAATVLLFVSIPKGFFPQQDTGILKGLADASQDISFDAMVKLDHQLMGVLASDRDVTTYATWVGGGRSINNSFLIAGLKPRDERTASSDDIINRLRPRLAQVAGGTLFLQSNQDINVGGRTSRTQYQYTLQDADLEELDTWAPRMLEVMKKLPQLRDVGTDQQSAAATVQIDIDRDQAARFGIQPSLIDNTLYDAFGQREVAQYFTQLNAYHVVLEVTPELQKDTATLDKLYITSPLTGQQVPLSTLVHYDTKHVGFLSVNHQGQLPAVTLSFNLAPGVALGQAVDAIQKTAGDMRLPAAITATFQGTAQAFQDSLSSEPYLIAAAVVVVYIILGMLYESYVHPLTILSTLPSAGVGALLMLWGFHFEFSLIALIGVLLLIGIVKKNGIMMVDFAIQAEREEGLDPVAAIRKACLLRFRPIMMTTAAALLSALPLMLESGTGSELRKPLGYAMVGGLLLSQALTLFTTPVIYLYLDRFTGKQRRRRELAAVTGSGHDAPAFPG
jgi:hydrophobe/amphiphile efflux-1 (HAE1) family protein